jgi:DNA repair photolyase
LLPNELSLLSRENRYGITLISLDESFRKEIEPGASPYKDRIDSLRALHDKGFQTWVSIEPYPTPNIIEQDFLPILEAIGFVDRIIFGRTNYNAIVSKYPNVKEFYNKLSTQVVDFCNARGIDYHIKDGTITS